MATAHAQVTVGTTATPLNSATETDSIGGYSIEFQCATAMRIGGSGVTWATGYPVDANERKAVDLNHGEIVYAVVQTGTATCYVFEQGA